MCASLQKRFFLLVSCMQSLSLSVSVCACVSESAASGWLRRGEAVAGLSEVLRADNAQSPRLQLYWLLNYVAMHTVTDTYLCCWQNTHSQLLLWLWLVTPALWQKLRCRQRGNNYICPVTHTWSPWAHWSGLNSHSLSIYLLYVYVSIWAAKLATKTQTGSGPYVCNHD